MTDTAVAAPTVAPPTWLYAVEGVVAAAFGIAVGMLLAAFIGPAFAPLEVVASSVIDLPPAPVKEFFTATFGTAAKTVVVVLVLAVVMAVAAWAGVKSSKRPRFGVQVMLIAGVVGAADLARRHAEKL